MSNAQSNKDVAVREKCVRISLACFHDVDDDGNPVCRQGGKAGTSYTTIARTELPEDLEKCSYCADEYRSPKACNNPNTLAYKLERTSAKEVLGK